MHESGSFFFIPNIIASGYSEPILPVVYCELLHGMVEKELPCVPSGWGARAGIHARIGSHVGRAGASFVAYMKRRYCNRRTIFFVLSGEDHRSAMIASAF